MELTEKYIRKPFVVHAVEITESNIGEIAKLVGVLLVDVEHDNRQYIQLNRKIVPMVDKAYIGWFLTKLGEKYRCFNPKSFYAQFMDYASPVAWVFGDDETVDQLDREGWNYHMDQIASRMLELPELNATDDEDSAPAEGIERIPTMNDVDAMEDGEVIETMLVMDARPTEFIDVTDEVLQVREAQPGVVARKRDEGLGLAVD